MSVDAQSTTAKPNTLQPSTTEQRSWEAIRADFPLIDSAEIAYLDNAASSQMPRISVERMSAYMLGEHANVHRGVHSLSQRATDAYEGARHKLASFLHAARPEEIVFTRGTTESINLVAHAWGRAHFQEGDVIVLTQMEHHSNIVPWQMLREELGVQLRVVPMSDAGVLDLQAYHAMLDEEVAFVALNHISNALGTVNPVAEMTAAARELDIPTLLDGAQALPHTPVDVQALDVDFYAFSGHKMCGPTGIGGLYVAERRWEQLQPYQGGGDMIASVRFEETTYNEMPHYFEAGTPAIAQGIGLGATVDYLQAIGMERIAAREEALRAYATERMEAIEGLRIVGQAPGKAAVLSFLIDGIHPHDIGTILDSSGVAIRVGHHCAEPVMHRLQIPGTARASLSFYNNEEDIDRLIDGLETVRSIFA